ncbi:7-alpha-hydroxysteroid dehydrogenase [Xylona heveae TC161]|uniref:7-alpha-hydroxysteroid dehydrogenase n=1 Tax=Xylona heveae (strain CBS 132557 / TC161) TaxID=1328760 RepID=A0A164ZTN7_XYLHT|nr:7-alpha-hydroxysteroid dehydrogenase [Xylona heveae TC161]KZF19499.1 7-alpha-hydroxysteroid dehydrogenase [Xylona heveae TC161]
MASKLFAIIAGVGPGTGASVARRFAQQYPVALLARNPDNYKPIVNEINSSGGKAVGFSADVTDVKSIRNAFEEISKEFGNANLAAAVFNVGGGFVRKPFLEITQEDFDGAVAATSRGTFNFSQSTLPLLLKTASTNPEYPPTLIFTGATASVKGSANFSVFAAGKWAQRAFAQSLAREFGPQGIHVSHAVIDGVIDIPRTKEWKFDAPDAKISPDAIADAYWHLHTQPRTTFTFEIDIRPYVEKW